MTKTIISGLSVAAICLMATVGTPAAHADQLVTNGPQTDRGDLSSNWSAARNVAESHSYDRLLATSPAFRHARMRKECGPVTDPQLRQQCLASFAQYEPRASGYGSSTPPHRYGRGMGD